ncbi:MAG: T9SS type A sorting domain-containing protein [Flavobacteriales bacterium]|nr:T9SS type A sorting domain-containing protein [Flavobacteriales bacterium]
MLPRIILLILCLPLISFAQSSLDDQKPVAREVAEYQDAGIPFEQVSLFTSMSVEKTNDFDEAAFDVDGAVFFDYQGGSSILGKSFASSAISIELPNARRDANVILDLIPVDLFSDDFISNVDVSQSAHYRGVVRGHDQSLVSLSVFEDEVIGFVTMDGLNRTLGKVKGQGNTHVLYSETSQDWDLEMTCSEAIPMTYSAEKVAHSASQRAPGDCIRQKFEIDESLTNVIGGLSQATNYGTGVFNGQQTLYANDGINVVLSELKVWTNSDPAPYTINGYNTLDSYQALTGSFNGDIAYLGFANFTGGVAASIGGICEGNPDNSKAIGGAQGFYNNLPTYSFDVFIISHEAGHLFGARHTHACVWNGNNTAIDGCAGFTEEGCPIPGNAPFAGTIMSYCSSADFNQGFHPQVAQAIQNYVASRTCTVACGPPTCEDQIQNGDETGVDCGGPDCPVCPTCTDGIQNGDEEGVDCGGSECPTCPCNDNGLNLTLNFDNYPEETSWEIVNSSGVTVESGGTYLSQADGSTLVIDLCLLDGCYDFNIFDSFGDGMCCGFGNGSYSLQKADGTILASGGAFEASESTNFCIEGEIDPDCVVFETAPVDLTKSFDPVNGVEDRVQLKFFKDSPQVAYASEDSAACDILFWKNRFLDPETGQVFGNPIQNPDSILLSQVQKTNNNPLFKWPVKYRADGANNAKRVDPNIRYQWKVRCYCKKGLGPVSPWSATKIFNTPNFDTSTGVNTSGIQADNSSDFKNVANTFKVDLYPNPTEGVLNLNYKTRKGDASTIMVMDMFGKVIYTEVILGLGDMMNIQLDMSDLSVGNYILSIHNELQITTERFTVTR